MAQEDAYRLGYLQGTADAGAALIGVVAAVTTDEPLINRMVERLGQIANAAAVEVVLGGEE